MSDLRCFYGDSFVCKSGILLGSGGAKELRDCDVGRRLRWVLGSLGHIFSFFGTLVMIVLRSIGICAVAATKMLVEIYVKF